MSKKFHELMEMGCIVKLKESEKEEYCYFLEHSWKDNFKASEYNLNSFPRWSIIAGYYAMHDLAKLFLAKKYNLKITKRVHFSTIVSFESILEEKELREKVIKLLKQAELYYSEIDLPIYLRIAKKERELTQYYTGKKTIVGIDKAKYFLDNIVKPFVFILEKLIR